MQNNLNLETIVDNGTVEVTVPTPKNWKCEKKNCESTFKHSHATYKGFTPSELI